MNAASQGGKSYLAIKDSAGRWSCKVYVESGTNHYFKNSNAPGKSTPGIEIEIKNWFISQSDDKPSILHNEINTCNLNYSQSEVAIEIRLWRPQLAEAVFSMGPRSSGQQTVEDWRKAGEVGPVGDNEHKFVATVTSLKKERKRGVPVRVVEYRYTSIEISKISTVNSLLLLSTAPALKKPHSSQSRDTAPVL